MSQVLDRQRTGYQVPVRHRSSMVERSLIVVGVLATLVGVYFQFAPSDWWLAHFSEVYHLGSYIVGGLVLAAGFGVYADRMTDEDGLWSARMIAGTVMAVAALTGAVVAAIVLVI